jgi:type VI secretion system protein ImpA
MLQDTVEIWLNSFGDDAPCGQNLEYDNEFLQVEEAARPQPEQEFVDPDSGSRKVIEGQSADWGEVRRLAESLLQRTRDLRVAVWLTRALLHTEGFCGMAVGLRLTNGLLEHFWDHVHPQLDPDDDNDPTMRVNALLPLVSFDAVLDDLRSARLVRSRQVGTVTVRDVEVAQGRLNPREGEQAYAESQLTQILADAEDPEAPLGALADDTLVLLEQLSGLLQERLGAVASIDFKPLRDMLVAIRQALPNGQVVTESIDSMVESSVVVSAGASSVPGIIGSRQDVVATLERIIQYLERAEPTNPAQLLIRRAQRVMNMNFLEAMNELAPEGLPQAERSVGSQLQQE